MSGRAPARVLAAALGLLTATASATAADRPPRNAVIFVADGLRRGSVNPQDTPVMARLQAGGVFFANSHAVYPTFTTPNASALATGHQLGDTGDFANALFPGFAVNGTETPFIEDDRVLAALDARLDGNFLGEASLLAAARAQGFSTAALGKAGPTLIQDVTQGNGGGVPATIVIDDSTGSVEGVALDPAIAAKLKAPRPPTRTVPNVDQQQFLTDALVGVILPEFKRRGRPFAVVFWSRDPDVSQHNQKDGAADWHVGINGPTSKRAVRNADDALGRILAAVDADPALKASTDVFVTSDHGFATLFRDRPPGFLAADVAAHLKLPLYDPDQPVTGAGTHPQVMGADHPKMGNALIGGTGALGGADARVIVAANGGSDLVYVPAQHGKDAGKAVRKLIADVAGFLLKQDYVDAVFADGPRGAVPGALSLADINLVGSARTPRPSIVVALHSYALDAHDPLQTQVDVSDTTLQTGQGMHGSFGPGDVANTMIAFGPDYKQGFVDTAPAGNADVALTMAHVLGLQLARGGAATGRVLTEALAGGPPATASRCGQLIATPGAGGLRTALHYQTAGDVRYLDAAQKVKGAPAWGPWRDALPCRKKTR
ncbi:MAG TPA: alkaline phosphatase family protein [Polyangia bacterium]|nr:alkaline phosphatase family protein [Polyangia bacterium]